MARRKVKPLVSVVDGSEIPLWVLEFVPSGWPGDPQGRPSYDGIRKFEAWEDAREKWARENLPNGVDSLPEWDGDIPDEPWDVSMI